MIKKVIRKILRALARAPLIGRPIRMAVTLYRLAEMAERTGRLNGELRHAAGVAATPDVDRDNLIASVPVTLRRLRRDVDALQSQLANLERHQS